ncbi:hypothetical protein OH77DRAFT_928466 [Trametes cingulata]|nr:hypothetical protein OH77DRAFT_928466 [Trametes cingulata]
MSYTPNFMHFLIQTGQYEINPYNEIEHDKDGKPVPNPGNRTFKLTEKSHELRKEAMRIFCEKYPPMKELPDKLPEVLRIPELSRWEEHSKDGYHLYYGFAITPVQLRETLRRKREENPARWSARIYARDPSQVVLEAIKEASGMVFDYRRLWVGHTLQGREEDSTHKVALIALYSNDMAKEDKRGTAYTQEEEAQVINWIAQVVSPVTKQEQPLWYWDGLYHRPCWSDIARLRALGIVTVENAGPQVPRQRPLLTRELLNRYGM